jgi:type IV secretion system protein VirB4
MRGDNGRFEMRADEFLPCLGHIKPNVVALEDGALMAVAAIPGLPFELEANDLRNARPHRINSLLQMIGDDNVAIHTNFVHGDVEPQSTKAGS